MLLLGNTSEYVSDEVGWNFGIFGLGFGQGYHPVVYSWLCYFYCESYCVVLYTFEIKYKYHWPATATYLYKPKWKEWIHMAIRALKPLESPVIDHCRERAVVGIRCPCIGLALIPDSTKYGHVE